jgi:hypothetical protein
MPRRDLLGAAGALAFGAAFPSRSPAAGPQNRKVKPIEVSFFQFQHILPVEATPWNGLINRAGSPSFAGPAESVELYKGLAKSGNLRAE